MRFTDKIAVVTGGACGIGQAIARGLGKEGAQVIILDRLEKEAQANANHIRSQGGRAVAMKVDALDPEQVKSAVDKIVNEYGQIDVLVNNIGSTEVVPFLESDESVWQNSLNLNLMLPLRFCRAVLPYMVKQNGVSVGNISSGSARRAVPLPLPILRRRPV